MSAALLDTPQTETPAKKTLLEKLGLAGQKTPAAPKVQMRWMIRRDLTDVCTIDAACYLAPWDSEEFRQALTRRNCIGMVLTEGETLIGYMLYELQDEALMVLRMGVALEHRRRHAATWMLDWIKRKLDRCGNLRREILADVADINLPAHLTLKACGFECIGVMPDHASTVNPETWERESYDVYRFRYRLPEMEPAAQ